MAIPGNMEGHDAIRVNYTFNINFVVSSLLNTLKCFKALKRDVESKVTEGHDLIKVNYAFNINFAGCRIDK